MAVALFDLDRTLIDVNSGRLWVAAEWRSGRIGVREVAWAGWWLGRYALGMEGGLDQAMAAAGASVAGLPEAVLADRVRAWFEAEVRHRLRPGGRDALRRHRERGDTLVLATSGSVYAARVAAEAFGLDDVVATTLEVVDGTLSGRVTTVAVGPGKASAVEAWARARGVALDGATFYTDSATDLALLERVAHPVVVHPDRALLREARARGWPIEDWGRAS